MATTIDPATFVINVPRADLTLIQSVPTEIRELNLNAFRLDLKDLEDDPQGMVMPKTHDHNTEVTLSGLTFARVIEILDPYSVTFEDGQYAVNLVGANSNVGDKVNVNQVSVRTQNSAGLISSPDIEYSSFEGFIHIHPVTGSIGTVFPIGTPREKVKTISDAIIINDFRGLGKIKIYDDMTINSGSDLTGFTIEADSHVHTTLTLDAAATLTDVTMRNATITGTLDGGTDVYTCVIEDITFFNGHIHNSSLKGIITLGGSVSAYIANCSILDMTSVPTIHMGTTGQNLVMPNYAGKINITNFNSATNFIGIGLNQGSIILDTATVIQGTVQAAGNGTLEDELGNHIPSGTWNGNVTIVNDLLNPAHIADHIWDEALADHVIVGSTGEAQAGAGLTQAEVADAVWDEATADHQTAGTTGKALSDAGGAGNPWDIPVGTPVTGSYGEYVTKKLLTFAKWIGLK